MSNKSKGIGAERELIHKFWAAEGWTACRVAGSGSMRYPSPDIIAGNAVRKLAIECKCCGDSNQYLDEEDVKQITEYAEKFNAEPWIAVRFARTEWGFLRPCDLQKTEKKYSVNQKLLQEKGLTFELLLKIF